MKGKIPFFKELSGTQIGGYTGSPKCAMGAVTRQEEPSLRTRRLGGEDFLVKVIFELILEE